MNHTDPDSHTLIQNWSGSPRIQRDLKRIPDIWIHQWEIISFNQGCRTGRRKYTSSHPNNRREKKSTNLWSNIQLRTFRHENKKRAWGFRLDLQQTENLKVFYGFMWSQELLTENTPKLQQFSHTVAALWSIHSSFTVIPPFLCISVDNDT